MPLTTEIAQYYLDCLQNPIKPLTPLELQFLENCSDQFYTHGTLSPAQQEKLEEIYTAKA